MERVERVGNGVFLFWGGGVVYMHLRIFGL